MNIKPEEVAGSKVFTMILFGCRSGSLTKLHTFGELIIGAGVVVSVFEVKGTVPQVASAGALS